MSSTRVIIQPYKCLNLDPASVGVSYSAISDVLSLSVVLLDIRWSGNSGSNAIELQSLRDGASDWESVDISSGAPIDMSASSGDHQIILSPNPFKKIRLKYTSGSGGEIVSAVISGKGY